MTCKEIGRWITDNIEKPLEQWFAGTKEHCTEARRWLEERRSEIEDWRRTQETRCREQPCQWACLCCNKWFCWIVDLIVRILLILIESFERIIDSVCTFIATLIWLIISILVQFIKWIVLSAICLLISLCSILILIGAIALLVMLLAIVSLGTPTLAVMAAPLIASAAVIAAAALGTARMLCEMSRCRFYGIIGWALKWAIVLGAVIALIALSPLSALVVAIYGGLLAALAITLEKIPCTLPHMLGLP